MSDLISRQDAIDAIRRLPNAGIHWFVSAEAVFDVLLKLPSAEQPERKTGRWIKVGRWGSHFECSNCRNTLDFSGVNAGRGDANYCPNCGAMMKGEKD